MNVDKVHTTNSCPNFKASVSQHLIDTAHNFINYGFFGNKKQCIYTFDQKAKQYASYGFDNYIIDYEKKQYEGIVTHYLTATKSNNSDIKKIIAKGKSLKSIIQTFLKMDYNTFKQHMKSCR